MNMQPYGNYYEYDYGTATSDISGFAGVFLGILLVFYLFVIAFGVAMYVLQSVGYYQIAKRRGIHNPWLAWLPVGNMWILGSISDQYQYVAKGKLRNRRKLLAWLSAVSYVLSISAAAGYLAMMVGMIGEYSYSGMDIMAGAGATIALLCYLAILVISVVSLVFYYIALYDLFASSDPYNSVMYIVLSIFINVTLPFFVFACRKKDLGMPPRKPQPAPQIPVAEVVEGAPVEEVSVPETSVETAPAEEVPAQETEEEEKPE